MRIVLGALLSFISVAMVFMTIFYFCRAIVLVVKDAYDKAKAEDRWQRTRIR